MRGSGRQRAVNRAVAKLGGPVATADHVGVRYQSVYLWQRQGYVSDLVYAYRLAKAAGIDISEFVKMLNPPATPTLKIRILWRFRESRDEGRRAGAVWTDAFSAAVPIIVGSCQAGYCRSLLESCELRGTKGAFRGRQAEKDPSRR